MTIKVRTVKKDDYEAWNFLFDEYLQDKPKHIIEEVWEMIWDKSKPLYCIVSTDTDNRVTGFVHYYTHIRGLPPYQAAYIQSMLIDREHRRKGHATALLNWLFTKAKEAEWESVHWSTKASNVAAQKLYDKIAEKSKWIYYTKDT